MKRSLIPIFYILLACVIVPLYGLCGQEPPLTTAEAISSVSSKKYVFWSNTAWGKMEVLVKDSGPSFEVWVLKPAKTLGWILKETKTGKTLSKGGARSNGILRFQIDRPFKGPFRLTLLLEVDHEQVPAILTLAPEGNPQGPPPLSGDMDSYQDDPDHPYHSMVRSLYEGAREDYDREDMASAIQKLEKARKLDPAQSQVSEFLRKIRSAQQVKEDLYSQAQRALKEGRQEEALAKVSDYLSQHPEDERALKMRWSLESHPPKRRPRKKEKRKTAIPDPEQENRPTPIPNNENTLAKADQVYNLGLESYRRGDFAAARKFWEQTLEIQPSHLQAQRNLQRLKEDHP